MKLTIDTIRPYLLLECISGSQAHNLATETSDTDIKGVFYLPKEDFYGLSYTPQVSNETNDIVYYELGRFVTLLCDANPNMLELLYSPPHTLLYQHPLITQLKPEWFLSKACIQTFAQYAITQIKRAQGLNKKIVNPVDKAFKTVLDFCYIVDNAQTSALKKWLAINDYQQQHVALVSIDHAHSLYAVYHDKEASYQGIIKKENATDVLLSSVSPHAPLLAYLTFNKEAYRAYCKQYRDYWEWVDKRNEARYQQNIEHGRAYDSKNMMHTFRLLDMALDIAQTGKISVWRHNREELLAIKQGQFTYEALLARSEQKIERIEAAFALSTLPDHADQQSALTALVNIRNSLYQTG